MKGPLGRIAKRTTALLFAVVFALAAGGAGASGPAHAHADPSADPGPSQHQQQHADPTGPERHAPGHPGESHAAGHCASAACWSAPVPAPEFVAQLRPTARLLRAAAPEVPAGLTLEADPPVPRRA